MIVTGFKPRFLMIKNTSQTGPWYMYDSERDNAGNNDKLVQANDSTAEFTSGANFVDFQTADSNPKELEATPTDQVKRTFTGQSVMTRLGRMRIVLLTYQMQSLQMRTQRTRRVAISAATTAFLTLLTLILPAK